MRILNSLAALTAVFMLSGCVSSQIGRKFDGTSAKKIAKGKTSKTEVTQLFGAPFSRIASEGGKETWIYIDNQTKSHTKAATYIPVVGLFAGGVKATSNQQTLTVQFDGETVMDCRYGTSATNTEMSGVLRAKFNTDQTGSISIPCEEIDSAPPSGPSDLKAKGS